jgi:thiamine-phosphate pyrophosphorylase
MNHVDISLYGILDPAHCRDRPLPQLARQAIEGGVTLLQYRDKHARPDAQIAAIKQIRQAVAGLDVPLLVNDSPEIARAAGADGVHLGRDDADPAHARRMLGEDSIIGLTVKTEADARDVRLDLANYVCIGGVFATRSKENPFAIGVEGWRELAGIVRGRAPEMPVGAIAGIDADNVFTIVAAGADGVAVISAIFRADDVAAAAATLTQEIRAARSGS